MINLVKIIGITMTLVWLSLFLLIISLNAWSIGMLIPIGYCFYNLIKLIGFKYINKKSAFKCRYYANWI